jgi:hypothetical protein
MLEREASDGSRGCDRCGRTRRLIDDDGPPICRLCVMAWAWFARAVTAGEVIVEPSLALLRHVDHMRPVLGCPICASGRAAASRRSMTRPKLT